MFGRKALFFLMQRLVSALAMAAMLRYNLLYREDEREMIPVCCQFDIALTPYSPLASGHLCRPTWDSESKRSTTDTAMRNK